MAKIAIVQHAPQVLDREATLEKATRLIAETAAEGAQLILVARTVGGLEELDETVYHVYDPRITPLDDGFLVMFAADTETGCRLGTARTRDFRDFEFVGLGDHPDIRNGVIFPARFEDRYLRYDRPNRMVDAGAPATGERLARLPDARRDPPHLRSPRESRCRPSQPAESPTRL